MLKNTRLATILFIDQEGSHIRVYYQDKNFIKESRYDHNNGWYTTEYDTVASDAGEKTPIAATVWADGKEIRVYYLNDKDKIVERKYSVDGTRPTGYWSNGPSIQATNVASRSAQTAPTQLAVARTGWRNDNIRIRLFYQSANNTLRQTMYRSDRAQWEDSLIESEDSNFEAPPGGGLAATSSGGIRLFYQNSQGILKGIKESGDEWTDLELESYTLDKNTAISTVSWVNRGSPAQIRLYAINGGKLVSRKYDVKKEEWAAPQVDTNQTVHKGTSIAAAGAFDQASASEKIKVFYQPSEKVIALFNAHETKREELGIPTTLASVAVPDPYATEMLGLVSRAQVDAMTVDRRALFAQRLAGYSFNISGETWTETRKRFLTFVNEFGLADGRQYLTRFQSESDTFWNMAVLLGNQGSSNDNGSYIGAFAWNSLYLETKFRLRRYLGVS